MLRPVLFFGIATWSKLPPGLADLKSVPGFSTFLEHGTGEPTRVAFGQAYTATQQLIP